MRVDEKRPMHRSGPPRSRQSSPNRIRSGFPIVDLFVSDWLALRASALQSNIEGQNQIWQPSRQDWTVHIDPRIDIHTLCIA